jgi:hypothetical protein
VAGAPYFLRKLQFGSEATAGTAVPATFKLVGEGTYKPIVDREMEEYPRGVRAPVTDGGFDKMKGSELEFEGNLTYEEILLFLSSGLCLDVIGGAGPYTHTFTPDLTAAQIVKSYTAEFLITDGTARYERESAFMLTKELEIELKANELATVKASMFGRAEQTSTVTADIPIITGRTAVPSNLFKVFINDAGADIGTTQKSGLIRAASLKIDFGNEPDYTLDGRADLDMVGNQPQTLTAELELTMEHNALAAAEVAKWRTASKRFIRLSADNGLATTANKKVVIDGCFVYTESPEFEEEDGTELVTMKMQLEYDSTWAAALKVVITNAITPIL